VVTFRRSIWHEPRPADAPPIGRLDWLLVGVFAAAALVEGQAVLDPDYAEDSVAEADANFVLTGSGGIVEIQGTAEREPFSEDEFAELLALARAGIAHLVELQKLAIL